MRVVSLQQCAKHLKLYCYLCGQERPLRKIFQNREKRFRMENIRNFPKTINGGQLKGMKSQGFVNEPSIKSNQLLIEVIAQQQVKFVQNTYTYI